MKARALQPRNDGAGLLYGTALAMIVAFGVATTAAAAEAVKACPSPASLDGNNDGFVTDKEADANSVKIFNALDENKDGVVSRWEYAQCQSDVTGLYRDNRDESLQERTAESHAAMDADKSGDVSFEEYMRGAQKRYGSLSQDGKSKVQAKSYGTDMKGYSANGMGADLNRDQAVSSGEAARDAANSYAMLDSDGDGKLTAQEWQGSDLRSRIESSFKAIDQNDDGNISRQEYSAAQMHAYRQASQQGSQQGSQQMSQADEPVSVWIYRLYEVN